jgi:hypothetical protein
MPRRPKSLIKKMRQLSSLVFLVSLCLSSSALARPHLPRPPILGFVPERGYTLGPTVSYDFETDRFIVGVESVAAKKIFWAALSTRGIIGEQSDFSGVLELGLNAVLFNLGLGYQLKTARFEEAFDPLVEESAVKHGPSFVASGIIPISDIKSDGWRLFGAVPLVEPYYRTTFFFSEGFAHEFGVSFRLWWQVRRS